MQIIVQLFKKHYLLIILGTLTAGFLSGSWSTVPGKFITNLALPLTMLMIFFIALTITPNQFQMAFKKPKAVLLGLALNFGMMPLLTWGLTKLLIQDDLMATGIILVGVTPCAVNASVWTSLLEGDTSISLAINALTMLLAVVLIPPLMLLFTGSSININAASLFKQVVILLLLPLLTGIGVRYFFDKQIQKILQLLPILSAIIATTMVFGISNSNLPLLINKIDLLPSMLATTIIIFPLAFFISYKISKKTLGREACIATTYSGVMKNFSVAIGLALTSFSDQVGLPIILAAIPQIITSGIVYRILYKQKNR